jgi:hypothetical protein
VEERLRIRWQCAPVGRVAQNVRQDISDVIAAFRPSRSEHLEQHTAERPDVGRLSTSARASVQPLRSSAKEDARLSRRRYHRRRVREIARFMLALCRLRQAEVEHFDVLSGLSLMSVSNPDARSLRALQRAGNLCRNGERFGNGHGPLAMSASRPSTSSRTSAVMPLPSSSP